jgi:hypothetical protein
LRFQISDLGFFGRVAVGECVVDALPSFESSFLGVGLAAGFFGEVSLAFDFGVLQGVRPRADLAGATFGDGFQI